MKKLEAVIWKEEDMCVIKEIVTGVTAQGKTVEEAINNLKEAMELYLEKMPELIEELKNKKTLGAIHVKIT